MMCPCKDCERKGCGVYHDICEKYQEFVRAKTLANKKERDEKNFIASIIKNKKRR